MFKGISSLLSGRRTEEIPSERLAQARQELGKDIEVCGLYEAHYEKSALKRETILVTDCETDVFDPSDELEIIRAYPDDSSVPQEELAGFEGRTVRFVVQRMFSQQDVENQARNKKPHITLVTVSSAHLA